MFKASRTISKVRSEASSKQSRFFSDSISPLMESHQPFGGSVKTPELHYSQKTRIG